MLGKIELVCVKQADTFKGNIYEAQVRCDAMDDGKALVNFIEQRESIGGYELKGYAFSPVCRMAQGEFHLGKELYVSIQMDGEPVDCMEAIAFDINNLLR